MGRSGKHLKRGILLKKKKDVKERAEENALEPHSVMTLHNLCCQFKTKNDVKTCVLLLENSSGQHRQVIKASTKVPSIM